MRNVELSIIIPTLNRTIELRALLQSIEKYVLNIEYEVIIIDQNSSGFLNDVVKEFNKKINLKHHIVSFKGLSKAKNFGANVASGELLAFPDDDCTIFADTYSKALETLNSENVDIVFGRCVDAEGEDSVLRFKKTSYLLDKDNMLGGFVSSLFGMATGGFMEAGTPYKVGETGTELFIPKTSGYMMNASRTNDLLNNNNSKGTTNLNITLATPNYSSFNNSGAFIQ